MATTVVNRRSAPFDVYIGRGSKWGNPFTHLPIDRPGLIHVQTREEAIGRYRAWVAQQPHLLASLGELRGKVLGCYCKPLPCHGDVLAEMAEEW